MHVKIASLHCIALLQNAPHQSTLLHPVKFVPISSAVVVVAKAHNPSILHPAFLKAQKIVSEQWELLGQSLSTPAISIVKYSNGISFVAENTRLVIREDSQSLTHVVQELATKYVESLPHVHYTAVGINFDGFIECEAPDQWLRNRFLKDGPGNDEQLKPTDLSLKFVYPIDNGILNLTCDSGIVRSKDGETLCVLLAANYHIPVSEVSVNHAVNAIASYQNRLAHFTKTTDTIFGLDH